MSYSFIFDLPENSYSRIKSNLTKLNRQLLSYKVRLNSGVSKSAISLNEQSALLSLISTKKSEKGRILDNNVLNNN